MQVAVIINEHAGVSGGAANGNGAAPDALCRALEAMGVEAELQLRPPDAIGPAIRDVIAGRNGFTAVAVGGGDGTVGTAAAMLAETGIPLAVLPLGTLNHFANDLGVPADAAGWARMIATGRPRAVDVGEVNGRIFVNNCSVGAYPEAVRRRDALRRQHGFGKWPAMWVASLEVLQRLRRLHVTMELDGETLVRRTPFVLVSNNRYTGHIFSRRLRPRIDDGRLWTYTTRAHRVAPVLRLAFDALTNGIDQADGLDMHSAKNVTVNLTETNALVAADGEIFKATVPLRFRIRPGALQVLTPPPQHAP